MLILIYTLTVISILIFHGHESHKDFVCFVCMNFRFSLNINIRITLHLDHKEECIFCDLVLV